MDKKLQIVQISNSISTVLRKQKNDSSLTVNQLNQPGFINELTAKDHGNSILRTIRGSPPYSTKKKRICLHGDSIRAANFFF